MIQSAIGVQALQNQLSRIKFFFKKLYPRNQEVKWLSSKNLAELLDFVGYLKYRESPKSAS